MILLLLRLSLAVSAWCSLPFSSDACSLILAIQSCAAWTLRGEDKNLVNPAKVFFGLLAFETAGNTPKNKSLETTSCGLLLLQQSLPS
jgi:hypothetical protein